LQREIFLIWLQEVDRADLDRFMEGIAATEHRNNTNNNNNEEGNKEGEIWVELNGSQNNHNNNTASELLQTVKSLQAELLSVKENNERMLKAQEALNQVLLNRMHKDEEKKK